MYTPATSGYNPAYGADPYNACNKASHSSDNRLMQIVGHFFLTCAAVAGIAFIVTAKPAALAAGIALLLVASACYIPYDYSRLGVVFHRRHYVPPVVYPPRRPVVMTPIINPVAGVGVPPTPIFHPPAPAHIPTPVTATGRHPVGHQPVASVGVHPVATRAIPTPVTASGRHAVGGQHVAAVAVPGRAAAPDQRKQRHVVGGNHLK